MQNSRQSTKVTKNGVEWTVREGYEDLQDKFNLANINATLQENPYTVIKDTKVRSVFYLPDSDRDGRGLYIKYFKERDSNDLNKFVDCVKHLFTKSKAKTEWSVGNRLLSENINTALPLAIAEKRSRIFPINSLLITRAISNSRSLMDFCQPKLHNSQSKKESIGKEQLINSLARFVREIHSKGFFHSDFHAGNILIQSHHNRTVPNQPYSFYLIDLHHVKMMKTLSKRKILYNLAQLFNSLSSTLTQSDKRQFFQSYGNDLFGNTEEVQELIEKINAISSKLRSTHYRSRLKRCLKKSSLFSQKKLDGFKTYYRKGYCTESLLKLLERHATTLAHENGDTILKQDRKTILTQHPYQEREIHTVVVKHYKTPFGIGILKNILSKSSGKRAWISGNGLLIYGFDAPLPITLIEKKIVGIVTDSYIIMEAVSHSIEMDRYLVKNFEDERDSTLPTNRKKKRDFIYHFAQIIAQMHNKKVFHQDLKTCNIMVKDDPSFVFTFLDFDKVRFGKNVTIQERIKNLTQINLSTPGCITLKDRLRFLGAYLRQCNLLEVKRTIRSEIATISKREKILYVSFKGDVTEEW